MNKVLLPIVSVRGGVQPGAGAPAALHARVVLLGLCALFTLFAAPPAVAAAAAQLADSCSNAAVRAQQHATLLPGCRAYEQVSPEDKGGNDATYDGAMFGSLDGDRFVLIADASGVFGGGQNGTKNQYVAARNGTGWTSNPVSPRTKMYVSTWVDGFVDFACDQCASVIGTTFQPVAEGDADRPTFGDPRADVYSSSGPDALQWLSGGTVGGTASADPASHARYAGRSADGSHLAFDVGDALLPEVAAAAVPASARVAYERTGPSLSELRVVGKDDSGAVMPGGSMIGGGPANLAQNAVSRDGRKIFFQSPGDGSAAHLYLRIDGVRTVVVSAPKCSGAVPTCDGTGVIADGNGDSFLGASPDGETVYFMSSERLLDDDTNSDLDIYRYDLAEDRLTRVSTGPAGDGIVATNQILRVSDDGTTVYFASTGVLTAVPNGDGEQASVGGSNTYVYRGTADDPIGEVRFVGDYSQGGNASATDGGRAVAMTPGGTTMVFQGQPSGPPVPEQVYRYQWESGKVDCLSCADAFPSALFSQRAGDQGAGGYIQGKMPFRPSRNVSDDGRSVFFESENALVDRDVNGKRDVYEWRDGTVYLLSSGTDRDGSYFLDASADGRDVFILTRAQLASSDVDEAQDVYDVRAGGGWPATTPPGCSGDACQGVPSSGAALVAAGSASFAAPWAPPSVDRTPKKASKPDETPKPKVSKVSTVHGTSTKINVKVSAKGKIATSGSGLQRSSMTAKKAGIYRVTVRLSERAQRTLKRDHRIKVRVTVRFTPSVGKSSSVHVSVTFTSNGRKER